MWVPQQTKGKPFAVVHNGDVIEGVHHNATTQISHNIEDQSNLAVKVLTPIVKKCGGRYYSIRGTPSHVGQSSVEEERVAKRLGAIPNKDGQHSRYDLWKRVGKHLVHFLHHVGTTSSSAHESSAVNAELSAEFYEACRWGKEKPSIIVRCLSEDTEVLSASGWVGIDDYKFPQPVMTWNSLTGDVHWETPTDVVKNPTEPEMAHFRAKGIDILVTPDHNMITRGNPPRSGWLYEKAENLIKTTSSRYIPISGYYAGRGVGLSEDEAWLLGVIIGDGTFVRNPRTKTPYGIRICQRDSHRTPIVDTLNRSGIPFKIHKNSPIHWDTPRYDRRSGKWIKSSEPCQSVYLSGRFAEKFIQCLNNDKTLKPGLLEMDRATFQSFFRGLVFADGSEHYHKFCNNNLHLMDQLQELCAKHGMKSSVYSNDKRSYINAKNEKCTNHVLHYKSATYATIMAKSKRGINKYGNRSWCVLVPAGAIVCRRNRTVFIVGNSHRHRCIEVRIPTDNGFATASVTAAWQLKTPFSWKISGSRLQTPMIGGTALNLDSNGDISSNVFVRNISRDEPE